MTFGKRRKKIVNVDEDAWLAIRKSLPNLTDRKRSIIVSSVFQDSGFKRKLMPELTDSKTDSLIKRILRGNV